MEFIESISIVFFSCLVLHSPRYNGRYCSGTAVKRRKKEKRRSCCFYSQFRCDNGNCLSRGYQCNGRNDCGDWSDESNCVESSCTSSRGRDALAKKLGYSRWSMTMTKLVERTPMQTVLQRFFCNS